MTRFLEWIRTHTGAISEALRQVMYVGLAFGFVAWTDAQQAVLLSAISAGLALFTKTNTIATTRIDTIVEKRIADRITGTGS